MKKKVTFNFPATINALLKSAELLAVVSENSIDMDYHDLSLADVNPIKAWAMLNDWEVKQREVIRQPDNYNGLIEAVPYLVVTLRKRKVEMTFYTVTYSY